MQPVTIGWIAAAALIIGAVVRILKSDSLTIALANLGLPPLPKRVLPWLSLVLGVASAILDVKLQGTPWPEAVAKGLVAGVSAIAGHELGVESVRKGKELLVLILTVSLATSACKPADSPRANTRAIVLTLADGVNAADLACASIARAKHDADLARACDLARDEAAEALIAAEALLEIDSDAPREIGCHVATALASARRMVIVLKDAGGKVPRALEDGLALAPMLAVTCDG